jgi:transposase
MDTTSPGLADEAEDAHTIGRRSVRSARVEVLTGVERRRSWTVEQKRAIVGESLGPDLTPTEVARKYRISTGQLYTWRQQLMSFQGAMVTRAAPRFAPVELPLSVPAPDCTPVDRPALTLPSLPPRPDGLIEILLPDGVSLRVDAHVDGGALRRVLGALADR